MNSPIQLCPKCNKHTNIQIYKEVVHINCQCGYYSTMNVKQIINKFHHNKSNNTTIDNTFSDIIKEINKRY